MSIDKNRLEVALSTIHKNKHGYFISSKFIDLFANVMISIALGMELPPISGHIKSINWDISNLLATATRLEWQKSLWSKKQIDYGAWFKFAALDIDLFHVKFRSIFDYFAKTIRNVSDNPEQVKRKSFATMKNWLKRSENIQRLGEDLAQLVLSCEWFDILKEVRESTVHKGGFTVVFPIENRILFQVHEGLIRKVLFPEIMFNKNVVDFELYAGLYYGYLISYLEEVSEAIDKRLNLKKPGKRARTIYEELPVIYKWIQKVASKQQPVQKSL